MASARDQDIDRVSPALRPAGRPCGFQRWSKLTFVHWRVRPSVVQDLLPRRLTVDTHQGSAWVGLVAFHMSGVRPWWCPAIPWLSSFHETNVRTYVHLDGRDPGVWFFSLDASSSLAVQLARWRWKLPYYRSAMRVHSLGARVSYQSERLWPGRVGAGLNLEVEIGDLLPSLDQRRPPGEATPGTLEHFLAERHILYSADRSGGLFQGRVHHTPYPLHEATVLELNDTLVRECGVDVPQAPDHVLYSPGVKTQIFGLRRV